MNVKFDIEIDDITKMKVKKAVEKEYPKLADNEEFFIESGSMIIIGYKNENEVFIEEVHGDITVL